MVIKNFLPQSLDDPIKNGIIQNELEDNDDKGDEIDELLIPDE